MRGGIATVKGVMGYIGKPIRPFAGTNKPVYGWQDIYLQKYPEIGQRLMGNCDIPDLDLFPSYYKIKNIRFSAGMESKLLHMCIWFTSWLIRIGLPVNLANHAELLYKVGHMFDILGTKDGGMHMILKGKDLKGKNI